MRLLPALVPCCCHPKQHKCPRCCCANNCLCTPCVQTPCKPWPPCCPHAPPAGPSARGCPQTFAHTGVAAAPAVAPQPMLWAMPLLPHTAGPIAPGAAATCATTASKCPPALLAPLAAPSGTCAQGPYPPVVPQPQQQWGQHAYPTVIGTHGVAWAWPVRYGTPTSALVPAAPVCKVRVGPSPPGGQSATIAPAHATAPHALLALLVLQPLLQVTHQAAQSAAAAHAALHALPTPRHHTPPHVLGGSSATHT